MIGLAIGMICCAFLVMMFGVGLAVYGWGDGDNNGLLGVGILLCSIALSMGIAGLYALSDYNEQGGGTETSNAQSNNENILQND